MTRPALVLFDLDDVLVDYARPTRLAVLARRTGSSIEDVQRALFDSGVEDAADRGRLDGAETLAAFARELGAAVTLDDWIAARGAAMHARPDMLALAEAVARRSNIAILTNNGRLLHEHLAQMHPALFPLFAGRVFCSAQFHGCKPEPAVYLDCVGALGVASADALFIDDNAANAEGARHAGLLAHHFRDVAGLRDALHHLDLLETPA